MTHAYNIHDLVKIESAVPLNALNFFRTKDVEEADLYLGIARVNGLKNGGLLTYRERLGSLGAAFKVITCNNGSNLKVYVSRLLAHSGQPLHDNLIEPLLVFIFGCKDLLLLHSACLSKSGAAVIISAPSYTGKTSTVIRCLKEGFSILSDDFTLVDRKGYAYCFPKPLTLRSEMMVELGDLSMYMKSLNGIRKMIYSGRNRWFIRAIGSMGVAITINSLVQKIFPSLKLDLCNIVSLSRIPFRKKISAICFLEKGPEMIDEVSIDAALNMLTSNHRDSFRFPPFNKRTDFTDKGLFLLREILPRVKLLRLQGSFSSWHRLLLEVMGQ